MLLTLGSVVSCARPFLIQDCLKNGSETPGKRGKSRGTERAGAEGWLILRRFPTYSIASERNDKCFNNALRFSIDTQHGIQVASEPKPGQAGAVWNGGGPKRFGRRTLFRQPLLESRHGEGGSIGNVLPTSSTLLGCVDIGAPAWPMLLQKKGNASAEEKNLNLAWDVRKWQRIPVQHRSC